MRFLEACCSIVEKDGEVCSKASASIERFVEVHLGDRIGDDSAGGGGGVR